MINKEYKIFRVDF